MTKKLMALSVDDGPNPETTEKLLSVLDKYGAKATFYFVGGLTDKKTGHIAKKVISSGNEIGNHGYDFKSLAPLTADRVLSAFNNAQEAIFNATGVYPETFRPAGLQTSDALFSAIPVPVIGGYSPGPDWEDTFSVEERLAGLRKYAADGRILLIHDVPLNIETLEIILPEFISEGYEIVTVSELAKRRNVKFTKNEKIIYREF